MTAAARLVSIQAGTVQLLPTPSGVVKTAIRKHPLDGPVALGSLGVAGDQQANLEAHGGTEKAVCVYPSEHFTLWERELGTELAPGYFGENFTTAGLLEDDIEVGAVYAVGGAKVRVTQPRTPCFKLAARLGREDMALLVQRSGRTGYYLSVVEEGEVAAGDSIELVSRPGTDLTIGKLNRLAWGGDIDLDGLAQAVASTELNPAWRGGLMTKLQRVSQPR